VTHLVQALAEPATRIWPPAGLTTTALTAVIVNPARFFVTAPAVPKLLSGVRLALSRVTTNSPLVAPASTILPSDWSTIGPPTELRATPPDPTITAAPTTQGQAVDRAAAEHLGLSVSDQLLISLWGLY
jgi:hypothetical protein